MSRTKVFGFHICELTNVQPTTWNTRTREKRGGLFVLNLAVFQQETDFFLELKYVWVKLSTDTASIEYQRQTCFSANSMTFRWPQDISKPQCSMGMGLGPRLPRQNTAALCGPQRAHFGRPATPRGPGGGAFAGRRGPWPRTRIQGETLMRHWIVVRKWMNCLWFNWFLWILCHFLWRVEAKTFGTDILCFFVASTFSAPFCIQRSLLLTIFVWQYFGASKCGVVGNFELKILKILRPQSIG